MPGGWLTLSLYFLARPREEGAPSLPLGLRQGWDSPISTRDWFCVREEMKLPGVVIADQISGHDLKSLLYEWLSGQTGNTKDPMAGLGGFPPFRKIRAGGSGLMFPPPLRVPQVSLLRPGFQGCVLLCALRSTRILFPRCHDFRFGSAESWTIASLLASLPIRASPGCGACTSASRCVLRWCIR